MSHAGFCRRFAGVARAPGAWRPWLHAVLAAVMACALGVTGLTAHAAAPGISVSCRDDSGAVFHTYSTFGRGVEVMMGAYALMDLTPQGRNERDVFYKMEWVRHHDRYAPGQRYEPAPEQIAPAAAVACPHCEARAADVGDAKEAGSRRAAAA
jgi:hypothetical protein